MDKTRNWYVVLNLFGVGSLTANGRVVSVAKGLAETQIFALSVTSRNIRDALE